MFTLLLKQNELVEEEEEEAGEEEVGFHHGLSRSETGRYSYECTSVGGLISLMVCSTPLY